jgi:hypothetical protein
MNPNLANAIRRLNDALDQANRDFPPPEDELVPQSMTYGVEFMAFLIVTFTQDPEKVKTLTDLTVKRLPSAVQDLLALINHMKREEQEQAKETKDDHLP